MDITRRKLLRGSALLGLSAVLPVRASMAGQTGESEEVGERGLLGWLLGGRGRVAEYPTHAQLAKQIEAPFQIVLEAGRTIGARLVTVTDPRPVHALEQRLALAGECFSVTFSAPAGEPLCQDTYRMRSADLGTFSMLLVPMGGKSGEAKYEGVVNRRCPQRA